MPRKVEARALLAPFDPLVFERSRAERLFDFRYRIEIYTPAEKRQYGYYVLPFLLGDRIVARVDFEGRPAGRRVAGARGLCRARRAARNAAELLDELELMQAWLGLERIEVRAGRRSRAGAGSDIAVVRSRRVDRFRRPEA